MQAQVSQGYRLSPQQKRLWLLNEQACARRWRLILCLDGELKPELLTIALDNIVSRHEILRTGFRWYTGLEIPLQFINDAAPAALEQEDWRQFTNQTQAELLEALGEDFGGDRALCASTNEAELNELEQNGSEVLQARLVRTGERRHSLLLTLPVTCADRHTITNLSNELAQNYASLLGSASVENHSAAEEPMQYADFSEWQNELLEGEDNEESSGGGYWREHAKFNEGGADVLLPLERVASAEREVRRRLKVRLSEADACAVARIAGEEGISVETLLLASWQTLLWRLRGDDRAIIVHTSTPGRKFTEMETAMGQFVSFLPIRCEFTSTSTFRHVLKRVSQSISDAHEWQEYFSWEKHSSEVSNQSSQIGFLFHDWPSLPSHASLGWRVSHIIAPPEPWKLHLECLRHEGDLELTLEYSAAHFDEGSVQHWLDSYVVLLDHVANNPEAIVTDLKVVGAAEREQQLVGWNQTAREYASESCLQQLFEAQVARTPEVTAVVYEGEQLTYAELNARANQLAHYLRELGVGPEVLVGLCLERSLEMLVGVLGILKAGGAYVPLDPSNPAERLGFMLADASVTVLVTQRHLLSVLPEQAAQVVCVDGDWPEIAKESEANPECLTTGENLCYVIYTSGSTGKPKGVLIPHRNLAHLSLALREAVYSDERGPLQVSVNAPIFFDGSVKQLIQLLEGHTLHLLSEEVRRDPRLLQDYIMREKLEVLDCTPGQLRQLLQERRAEQQQSVEKSWLKVVLVGGEALAEELWEQLAEDENCRYYNVYGPTECTVDATVGRVRSGERVSIGRAVSNTEVYVLDQGQEVVPVGVVGELYLGGAGLARGYLNQPELTAEKFVKHPFSVDGEARLYRTGDLVRYLSDGRLEFVGRLDSQVKVRGYRVELGEVETVLSRHSGVKECVVVAREEENGDKRLVAYVVTASDVAFTPSEWRSYLQEKLPEYMVPPAFVQLNELPLTRNGKVDRQALPAPEQMQAASEEQYVAPRNAVEELIAGIWSEVLKVERVGRTDNFFELGGHSLLATQVISRVREICGTEVGLRHLFERPRLNEFAETVAEVMQASAGVVAPPLERASREGELPLSFAQQRLWFIDQLEPGSHSYNIPAAVRLSGELNVMALEQTLSEIVKRHESLRTSFTVVGSEPVQVIAPAGFTPLPIRDLSLMAEEKREAEARRLAAEEAREPFDLSTGPLFRAQLLRLSDSEHILLCTMHHVVSDGWSMGVLIREVAALYQAYSAGAPSPLKELTIQYADFAAWQREWLTGEVLESQLSYWKQQLQGAPAVLELPTDRPRPAVRSYRGARHSFQLSEELSAGLKELSRREGATLFMVLLAAFDVLLSRYTGQDDIVVGTPVAGRNHREIESLIGFFINTLVLRVDLSAEPSFREVVRRVREVSLGAYAHQDIPFEKLVEELQPERALSHQPLFQVVFTMQNAPREGLVMPGLRLQTVRSAAGHAKFDLQLTMVETGGRLAGTWSYSTEIFEAATIQRLEQHFQQLLQAVVAEPEAAVCSVALLNEAERAQQLVEWNQTTREYESEQCIQQLFEAQVERTPEAVAVVYEAEQLTYAKLNERTNQLAHYLRGLGVGPEVLVGICVERSLEMVVGVLGILKAGGAYVPLDADYPLERLSFMLEDAGVGVLLTQARLEEKLPAQLAQVVCMDRDWPEIAKQSPANPECLTTAENLCYVIYTSGSTGEPKGVLIPHRGVTRLLCNVSYVQLDHTRVLLQLAPLSFDASTFELWGALLHGGSCVLWAARLPSAGELRAGIARYGITTMWLTASLFNAVVDEEEAALGGLKQLLIGGEALSVSHVRRARAALPEVEIINGYGPTESTTFSCCESIGEVESGARGIPIGRAIANTEVYVLDQGRAVVPVGVVGELYIGGAGLARGYLNQPELTAEKFVKHPFSETEAARLYRTGDLVRYLSDGRLEFVGRLDSQVKVRGYRIELGEIETVLSRHSGVQECVVVAREEENGDKRLVAYVVSGVAFTTSELRSYLQEKLPEYMVPAAFVALAELPLTRNGKVDRQALPAPEQTLATDADYVAPRTPVEEIVAGIWSEVLKVERIGSTDNFFELGGHSLLATQVISRVRETFRVEIPLRMLFESSTLDGFATNIGVAVSAAQGLQIPPIERNHCDSPQQLSFAQQRLWFIDQMESAKPFYNIPMAVRLTGELNITALEQTLSEIVCRHEVLRTTFMTVEGEPIQIVQRAIDLKVPMTELGRLPEAEREAEARRLTAEEARAPFDLSTGPLFRVQLLRLSDSEHVLLCTMHHVVSDGWSMGVLIREVAALYQAYSAGAPSPLKELTIQYADFAAWQREWLTGEVLESQLSYWKQQLQGAPAVLELPTDRPRPAVRSYRGARHSFQLSEELSAGLKELSRREGATLFMVLLAAFDVLLSRYTGQDDIVVGTPVAGRNHREIESLIGFFINTLVLRVELSAEPSFREVVRRVREVSLGAYAHQDIPFEKLVEELQPERALSHQPLFQVVFTMQNAPREGLVMPGLQLQTVRSAAGHAKFDLQLTMVETGGRLAGTWSYSTEIFEAATIQRLEQHFQQLLQAVVAEPEAAVCSVALLNEAERAQQLVEWNQTGREYESEQCIQQLFEAQVERTPEAVAVVYEAEQLTYAKLNERANQLAHYLRGLGVGPEVLVGLCVERSLEMVVGVLGILKAGGAYVPLDADYPLERLSFMLEDAGVGVLLTQARLEEKLPAQAAQVVCLDSEWEQIAEQSTANPECLTTAENLCYVIYTSGSTGRPKGVEIEQRGLVNYVNWSAETYPFGAKGRTPVHSSLSFDLTVTSLYVALVRGGCLELIAEPRFGLSAALEQGAEFNVLKLTPGQLQLLNLEVKPEAAGRVKALVLGGENLLSETVTKWLERSPDSRVFNEYGPTETVVGCCIYEFKAGEEAAASVPIGGAIANSERYILDERGALLPLGASGEIYIGGAGVGRGYLHRPELTAERFVPHPYSTRGGERLYRTGDVGRYRASGTMEYLGRLDQQVKVRGYRVELGEVEAVLSRHSGVQECVVVAREEESGDKRLVAYVVTDSNLDERGGGPEQPLYQMPNNLKVAHLNKNETDFVYQEIFKNECYLQHGITLNDGDCVFDVGANIGLFTLFINQRCAKAQVYAFEPVPATFEVLRTNVELYGLNVKLFNCGLFSEPTTLKFTHYPRMSVMSGAFADPVTDEDVARITMQNQEPALSPYADGLMAGRFDQESYDCQVRTISGVMREEGVSRIDLLKIDVEKSELEVLKGIAEEDWQKIRQIVVEVHDVKGEVAEVEQLLERHGFKFVRDQDAVLKSTGIYDIYAVHPARQKPVSGAAATATELLDLRGGLVNTLGGEMRRYLQEQLPEYMVPSVFVQLSELPLTRNGKVDRAALPAPEQMQATSEEQYVAPRTAVEELIAGIWSEVLKVEQVSSTDNFFDLGGHSLLATQVISRVREVCGVELAVRVMFESPTVAQLAQAIEAALGDGQGLQVPAIRRVERDAPPPLSFAQQRLWFIDQLEPGSHIYNIPAALRLSGELNVMALELTLSEIVGRHEVLRTSFMMVESEPVQVIAAVAPFLLPVTDLTPLADAEREAEARRLVGEEARAPFDLSTGPLFRAQLLHLSDSEHILLCTMHHVVSDGWSMGVLIREVAALYQAYSAGAPSPLKELTIQYADFAAWQREWLTGEVLESQLSYWKQQLQGAPAVLELPTDRPRPAVRSYRGARHSFQLSEELSAGLKELSRREGATLFMVLLAAFDVLLSRYTGQDDIVVGTPVAGRNHREIESLIGFFINTLVLRVDLSAEPSFREVVRRVREVSLGAYAHQDIPFEKLVEELQPERALSHQPLFQVVFTMQNAPREGLVMPGLKLQTQRSEAKHAKFDLQLTMVETGGRLAGTWSYSTEIFEAATIQRLEQHFQQLLQAVVAEPEAAVCSVALLTEAERAQQLVEWNQTGREYESEQCIQQLFEAQVERTPEAVAVVYEAEQLTYAKLNERANQLAHYLRGLGVGPEVLVGICVERSLEMVVGVLGILKAGGAYVPLDADYPLERLSFMLEDAGVGVLLTQARLEEKLPAQAAQVVCLDSEWEQIAEQSTANPECLTTAENLCYVIYTSGSTGRPKGVEIEQRGLVNYVNWSAETYPFGAKGRTPVHSSLSFDLTVTSLYVALVSGGCLELVGDPRFGLSAALEQGAEFNVLKLTPGQLQLLNLAVKPEAAGRVKALVLGGENLLSETVTKWLERSPDSRVFNEYGPTETVVGCCIYEFKAGEEAAASVPIGGAIANSESYILDERGALLPLGASGEIYIGGAGVGRGYLQRPDLTAERFVPHPYSTRGGERLYRTGDVGRYRASGTMEYLGRLDQQVKVRGYRVELGEVEAVLSRHSGVQECVVVAREEESGDKRLVAYVVAASDVAFTPSELRSYLQEKLPEYMVPAAFVDLDELPLTRNGKVDRQALPAPEQMEAASDEQYVAPRSAVEEIVAGIWSEVLKVERVSSTDNFFELGGHSLLATQVISRVREVCGTEVGLRHLFERPRLGEFAGSVAEQMRAGAGVAAPALERVSREGELPLSFAQQRLWFIDQLEPGSNTYNIPAALRLSGELNVMALEQTLSEIVSRHEVLRTSFMLVEGEPVQVIAPVAAILLPITDLSLMADDEREVEARRLVGAEAREPFELSTGPLFRAQLLRLSEAEHILLCTMHHVVSDGWSMGVLIREVAALYQAYSAGESSPLKELTIQYADFAAWQREWLTGEVLESQLSYWKQQLQGAPAVLELPTDRPRPAVRSYRGARHSFQLSAELSAGLKELSRREGATLFMVLLAAFDVLLSRYTGQDDIVVGTPVAGRNHREIESLIGFFINTLVLRVELSAEPSFREVVRRVREVSLGAYAHQDIPFEKLVEELQPERALSHQPLFQVVFTMQNAPREGLVMPGLRLQTVRSAAGHAKFDLQLTMVETGGRLGGTWSYSTEIFEATTMERLAEHFQQLLAAVVAEPEVAVCSVALLNEAEREQQLVEWNQTGREYESEQCIQQLFEAQVERTPEALAVVYDAEQLTYAKLNERANQLAHYLRGLGVGPEVLVGICVERSLEMVIGLLGILKAGAAYVPLEPSYPQERLSLMIEEAGIPVVLTAQRFREIVSMDAVKSICLDVDWKDIAQESKENPTTNTGPGNLAYVIYTSGSTGKPKGSMITHEGICNRLLWMQQVYQLTAADRVLQKTAYTFDVSVWEFFWPLIAGARLVMARPGGQGDSRYLVDLIQQQEITTLHFVPSMLAVFLEETGVRECRSLKRVICSGEALPYELKEKFVTLLEPELHNLYGPTEASVDVTYWDCRSVVEREIVPIGRPIANTQIYVLDKNLQAVPVGVRGELYIGGVGLARAYLQRADLTAERFLPDPFGRGGRIYRTGDLARYLADGNIEYLGRTDHQVKLRGFRVELGEVEAVLSRHSGVKECVVVAREEESGDKRLVAYVVAASGVAFTPSELRSYLQERLPDFMIPSALVQLSEFPLTRNGKVDRQALSILESINLEARNVYIPPRDSLELELTQLWEELLNVRPIGMLDNFFTLGGHSLLAVRMIAATRQKFGTQLTLVTLFEDPTIEHLAGVLRQHTEALPWSSLVAINAAGSKRPFFCVHPAGGNVVCFAGLSRSLGSDQPFYGLQSHGLNGLQAPDTSLKEMAVRYLELVRTVQVKGPYRLGGFSMGGAVAFEMAQQLMEQGEEVDFLALLDTTPPTLKKIHAELTDASLLCEFAKTHNLDISLEHLAKLEPADQLPQVFEEARKKKLLAQDLGIAQAYSLLNIFKHNVQAIRDYVPQVYSGPITLFSSSERVKDGPRDETMGWGKWATQRVTVKAVPGNHQTMLDHPHVQILAELMKPHFD